MEQELKLFSFIVGNNGQTVELCFRSVADAQAHGYRLSLHYGRVILKEGDAIIEEWDSSEASASSFSAEA